MGPLALALGTDSSIQRLPEIVSPCKEGSLEANEQAFYSSQAELAATRLKNDLEPVTQLLHDSAAYRSTTSGIKANEYLIKNSIGVPASLVN